MKILVGYNGSPAARRALDLALAAAKSVESALVYVVTSMEGGSGETLQDIQEVEEKLHEAKAIISKAGVACETLQLARGLSPGEDIVRFAEDNSVNHIFLGIEKKSRTRKILLGSTAQYIILRGPCPVTTTK
ncbi:MAG: universal stress protein [Desulfobacteraceae bacterium]|nr:universal stress protein [Desulfobacteraceae bacterium]